MPGQPILQADVLKQTASPPKNSEKTLPHPQPVQTQQPNLSTVGPSIHHHPRTNLVADAVIQQQTIASPKHPKMALQYPEPVQALKPTALSFDIEVAKTQQSDSDEMVPPMTEVSYTINICEFCTCSIGTLSCIHFGSNQKLSKVPVPETSTYNSTFTIL